MRTILFVFVVGAGLVYLSVSLVSEVAESQKAQADVVRDAITSHRAGR